MTYVETMLIPVDDAPAYRAVGWRVGSSSTPGRVTVWRVARTAGA